MKFITLLLILLTQFISLGAKPSIDRSSVAVLYNSTMPASKELAEYYAEKRNIPVGNLVGLSLPQSGKISREQYVTQIQEPLRKYFDDKGWWKIEDVGEGIQVATRNKIRVLVCVYGVPYGVNQDAALKLPDGQIPNAFTKLNCASVDSELAALAIGGVPIYERLRNKYFKQDISFSESENSAYMLVGRIDAPTIDICKRMINDSIEVENTGLWGMAYLDLAYKGKGYKVGDDWLDVIEKKNWQMGIPTTVDKNKDTYLTNYPMRDAAMYFGWYAGNVNGPFRNSKFKFKKGAVAVHLHSFSASDLRNPKSKWVGPLLERGAAATVGNVYEPYLTGSHHFDILHDRLIKGYSLVESAYMAIPQVSWQNVVIGDPLYQPYKHLAGTGEVINEDRAYRASRMAFKAWGDDLRTLIDKLRSAGIKSEDARFFEVIGLFRRYQNRPNDAKVLFEAADKVYTLAPDKVRIAMHKVDLFLDEGQKDKAIIQCKAALIKLKEDPSALAIKAKLNILSPPPPPPAQPNKKTPSKN